VQRASRLTTLDARVILGIALTPTAAADAPANPAPTTMMSCLRLFAGLTSL